VTNLAETVLSATLADFEAAARRIAKDAIRTPALPFPATDRVLHLKAECLQPLGSFKIRAAANAIATADPETLKDGVITGSAGNFGQGIALAANSRGLPVKVFVPDTSAEVKIAALREMGAEVQIVTFDDWWQILMTRATGTPGLFVHPVAEVAVVMGNGTIGLEIAEQVPEADTVVVPVGGGGMISGIALALKASGRKVRIIAAEIESSVPVRKAKAAGHPVKTERGKSWVDGIGSTTVLDEMWPLIDRLVDDTITITHDEAAEALRLLAAKSHLVVEGAAAVSAAATLHPSLAGHNVVAVLSGGNIDLATYARFLTGAST
jgi:threonine dehydratase